VKAQARLDLIRRHIPHGYWLAFDAVMAVLCLIGLTYVGWIYAVGLVFLAVALAIDLAEFILKKQGAR
jgi:hypothetical protein